MTMLMLDNTSRACVELQLTSNAIKAASRAAMRCAVVALGAISIGGCGTPAEFRPIVTLEDDDNVTLSYVKGAPQLTSRGISTQVELTPLDNRISNGDDVKFAVSVLNVGAPFFFGPDNVSVIRWKESEQDFGVVPALSFDQWAAKQRAGGTSHETMAALATLSGLAAGAAQSLGTYYGSSSLLSSGHNMETNTTALLKSKSNENDRISDSIFGVEMDYCQGDTVPERGEVICIISFGAFDNEEAPYVIEVVVPEGKHQFGFGWIPAIGE